MKNIFSANLWIATFFILSLFFTSCNQTETSNTPSNEEETIGMSKEDFDYGLLNDGIYENDFFNFSIEVPQGWKVQDDKQMKELVEVGKEVISDNKSKLRKIVDASMVNTAYLLTAFKHEVGAKIAFNPSFMVLAENTRLDPRIKKGDQYLSNAKILMQQGQIPYEFDEKGIQRINVGGKEFYFMDTEMTVSGQKINQRFYSRVEKGFSLGLIISFNDEEQKKELEAVIAKAKFKK